MSNDNSRTESDLLGSRKISNDCYYGIHTQRAIENFDISGIMVGDFPEFIRALILTKKACAIANGELKAISDVHADMIVKACDHIITEIKGYQSQFPTDVFQGGAETSVNMNTNEVIANVALELAGHPKGSYDIFHQNNHVNECQSTK